MAGKPKYTRKSPEEIKQEVNEAMAKALPNIRLQSASPADRQAYLDFMSTGYRYSARNMAIVKSQYPGASFVGSYNFWKEKGFSVTKGEKAIKILVPHKLHFYQDPDSQKYVSYSKLSPEMKRRVNAKDKTVATREGTYYDLGNVFDVLQTAAKPEDYPSIFPNRPFAIKNPKPEQTKQVIDGLKQIAKEEHVPVQDGHSAKFPSFKLGAAKGATISTKGQPREIVMKPGLSDPEYAATLIHELAHAKMHNQKHAAASKFWSLNDPDSPEFRDIKEFQAEMTSYVVSKAVGLDTSEEAMPYIAGWTNNLKQIEGTEEQQQAAIMTDVQRTSREMIEDLQTSLAPAKVKSQDFAKEAERNAAVNAEKANQITEAAVSR